MDITTQIFPEQKRQVVEVLYQAFAPDIHSLVLFNNSAEQAMRVIEDGLDLDAGLYARHDGRVVGVLGWDDGVRTIVRLRWGTLLKEFGLFGALFRWVAFLMDQNFVRPSKGELYIPMLAVDASMRGQGVGTSLMNRLFEMARGRGCHTVRLDVLDDNPRARQLYERLGFVARKQVRFGFMGRRAGFESYTVMTKSLI